MAVEDTTKLAQYMIIVPVGLHPYASLVLLPWVSVAGVVPRFVDTHVSP